MKFEFMQEFPRERELTLAEMDEAAIVFDYLFDQLAHHKHAKSESKLAPMHETTLLLLADDFEDDLSLFLVDRVVSSTNRRPERSIAIIPNNDELVYTYGKTLGVVRRGQESVEDCEPTEDEATEDLMILFPNWDEYRTAEINFGLNNRLVTAEELLGLENFIGNFEIADGSDVESEQSPESAS